MVQIRAEQSEEDYVRSIISITKPLNKIMNPGSLKH